ncbi:GTPase ObgE [Clostridia bacterium]|nr:GTPase ObgE [Clostridia bacterium]
MFFDRVKINVKAGNGGDGCISFRREKYVDMGGPNGGDGGDGGSIYLEVDESLRTLVDFKYKRHVKGARGVHGRGSNMHGKNSEPIVLKVPPGTLVKDEESGVVLADLTQHGQRILVAKGGRGGRGNARFMTNKNKAPRVVENGEPGEEKWIELELKLLADVGLAGYPNAGKSTLISSISGAKPKIADYPFTTLTPNLGVIELGEQSFVMADIPGLIQGAHLGAGLGHDFLKHLERTRLIVHVVDVGTEVEGLIRDPYEEWVQINDELRKYSENFLGKYHVVVASKMDLPGAEDRLEIFRNKLPNEVEVFPISAVTKQGTKELCYRLAELLEEIEEPILQELTDYKLTVAKEDEKFQIHRDSAGTYVVEGKEITKKFIMNRMDSDEALMHFHRILVAMGVIKALKKKGIQPGDTVRIMDMEFDFVE